MITGDIKTKIDKIWNVFFAGGITNPITVLEQMTYLFFMKMLDDAQLKQEANAALLDGAKIDDAVFKEGNWHNPDTDRDVPYDDLRWSVFKNKESRVMFDIIRNDAFSFIKNLNTGKQSAYSKFMKDAVFLIQNPRTLQKVVDGVNELDMNNRDTMGDVYEYILGKMAASGNNGQFRTPRHIIQLMVRMMRPTLDDTICDPAMGSAGFIVESAKYVAEKFKKELLKPQKTRHYKTEMFHGFDTDSTMLRIGAMNLMLHNVDSPDIKYQDSLSTSNTDTNTYTLCLANPPFSGNVDNEDISKTLLEVTNTKKSELLFMSLFVRMLRNGGRCASIVPDGVLSAPSKAHLSLRKELVDKQCLKAVISMPSGVFEPYAGVSTAILIFTKTNAGGTDKVWFYDMKAEGYSLDKKRQPIDDNDIPDIIARWENPEAEESRTRKDQSFFVPVEEIRKKNYDLSINNYKEIERIRVKYDAPNVILNRITKLETQIFDAIKSLNGLTE